VADYEIVNIPTATYRRECHENFNLTVDISFGQSEVLAGESVLESLKHMAVG
jgi:hypothetical protein